MGKTGTENNFRDFVDKYKDKVFNTCYGFVHNVEDAEDLTQEVFIQLYESLSSFRGEAQISTWLYRIAINKSLDHLRAMKRQKRWSTLKKVFVADLPEDIPDHLEENPQTILEEKQRIRVLEEAMGRLPENQRIVFTLSKYEKMSHQEISEIMEISISATEALMHRAKLNLRKILRAYYEREEKNH